MRKLAIAIGIAAILIAVVLAARDNTAQQTTAAIQPSINNGQPATDSSAPPAISNSNPELGRAESPKALVAARDLFLVRAQGAEGKLIAYDLSNGTKRFTLPRGLLSADAKHYFSTATRQDITSLFEYDPTSALR